MTKNTSLYFYESTQIKDLLGDDKVEEALKILRGVFPKDDELISQLSRISHLNFSDRTGQLSLDENNRERNKIIAGVLEMLKEREEE